MRDQLPESESHPVALDYASGDTARSRVPLIVWIFNAMVLVVLGALILPAFPRQQPAYRAQCGANEKQLVGAIVAYAKQNQGNLPPTLRAVLPPSITSQQSKLLQCPLGPGAYVYLGAGLNLNAIPRDTILIYEPPGNHKNPQTGKTGMNIAQVDGAVHLIESPRAEKIIAELKAGHNPPRAEKLR